MLFFLLGACRCCLGILPQMTKEVVFPKLFHSLKRDIEGYDKWPTFSVSFYLPNTFVLRQLCLTIYLKEKFGKQLCDLLGILGQENWSTFAGDVRDVGRNMFINTIESGLEKQHDSSSPFHIAVNFDFSNCFTSVVEPKVTSAVESPGTSSMPSSTTSTSSSTSPISLSTSISSHSSQIISKKNAIIYAPLLHEFDFLVSEAALQQRRHQLHRQRRAEMWKKRTEENQKRKEECRKEYLQRKKRSEETKDEPKESCSNDLCEKDEDESKQMMLLAEEGKQKKDPMSTSSKRPSSTLEKDEITNEDDISLKDSSHLNVSSFSHVDNKAYAKMDEQLLTNNTLKEILTKPPVEVLKEHSYIPPPILSVESALPSVMIRVTHDSVLVGGNYLKFSRILPQTPWTVEEQEDVDVSAKKLPSAPHSLSASSFCSVKDVERTETKDNQVDGLKDNSYQFEDDKSTKKMTSDERESIKDSCTSVTIEAVQEKDTKSQKDDSAALNEAPSSQQESLKSAVKAPRYASCVQDEIGEDIVKLFRGEKSLFHSAGREDVDVRMLGNGRPFVIEVINPKCPLRTQDELKSVEDEINHKKDVIQIRNLHIVSKDEFQHLKEGENQKRKVYSAVVWTEAPQTPERLRQLIDTTEDVLVKQLTPLRVLHRRSLAEREKVIHSMKTFFISPHYFILHLETSAGTYVKEFVHGDMGRTQPNIGGLLSCDADILQLDVLELKWDNETKEK
ncbi:putative tRNA pseudouridine [Monocercomonoides exilis]|uniref:putative tRNA pseudouridine n=1 Tax=Monocercomonoides exilis TaxID=2049356 RepID=UPI003559EAEB|nr:putative tRNA pseudouridine [Monocercomonoides exilis]|eukprot:MONOS_2830.1-p1 / transcript=MONOS_2830.1 / gene=MONOS_2830 / organism=Monocercomonoides_exilis_PA203 / gene_product=tRNA pseudouridine / transcript_product=tRNA pseudouridine / location=Mono_scaffold00061:26400-29154(-) / protein_length=731 / sequence_SO=supercontig / SO=protein_coding / is_pseudo=false